MLSTKLGCKVYITMFFSPFNLKLCWSSWHWCGISMFLLRSLQKSLLTQKDVLALIKLLCGSSEGNSQHQYQTGKITHWCHPFPTYQPSSERRDVVLPLWWLSDESTNRAPKQQWAEETRRQSCHRYMRYWVTHTGRCMKRAWWRCAHDKAAFQTTGLSLLEVQTDTYRQITHQRMHHVLLPHSKHYSDLLLWI